MPGRGNPIPPTPWELDAVAARPTVDRLAVHPAEWSDEYRAVVRRVLSVRLFCHFGACEMFGELLDAAVADEESGRKRRLWESDLASQRLVDRSTIARY